MTGSTPSEQIKTDWRMKSSWSRFDTYAKCADVLEQRPVEVVTTDSVILLGFAAENDGDFKVVGEQFSEERYGIGNSKGDVEICEWITDTLKKNEDDDDWARRGRRRSASRGHRDPGRCPSRLPAADRPSVRVAGRRRGRTGRHRSREESTVEGVTENLDLFWSGLPPVLCASACWGMSVRCSAARSGRVIRVSPSRRCAAFGTAWVTADPQQPAHRGAVLLRLRPAARSASTAVLLRLRASSRPDALHLLLRVRGGAVRDQRRAARPGRGGAGHRADVRAGDDARSCSPRRSGPRCRRVASVHDRAAQEHHRRGAFGVVGDLQRRQEPRSPTTTRPCRCSPGVAIALPRDHLLVELDPRPARAEGGDRPMSRRDRPLRRPGPARPAREPDRHRRRGDRHSSR